MGEDGFMRVRSAWHVEGGRWTAVDEAVALEVPLSIAYGGRFVGAVACTPQDVEDLVYGYLYGEGVIDSAACVAALELTREARGIVACAEAPLPAEVAGRGVGGCGRGPDPSSDPARAFGVASEAVCRASASLLDVQVMHRKTGATHAAAFADLEGRFVYLREDIGRHTAVDKLIGAMVRDDADPLQGFVHLSSRCALELVEKCAKYGIRLVSTISAPTTAVLEFAERRGVTLCGFSREGRFTVYTHPERLS